MDFKELELRAGRAPFEKRLRLDASGFCACPFHTGDSDKSMHLHKNKEGIWRAKCFSTCNESWGPLDFVMKFDNLPTLQAAAERLGGRAVKPQIEEKDAPQAEAPTPRPKPMTIAEFEAWGHELTPADVERFAKSRKGKGHTASFETWRDLLRCRAKGDYIGFPYFHPSGEFLYTLKLRHMDKKDFTAENAAANDAFFNLNTINEVEPVYIVEGEPDVAVLEEMGYRAVSPLSASQPKFDKHALADIRKAAEIYIVGDQDIPKRGKDPDPGQALMDRLEKELTGNRQKVYRIKFATEGTTERVLALKDVSALLAHYGPEGFEKRFEALKTKAREWTWVADNIPQVTAIPTTPQPWLVDRMIPYGGLTMVAGEQGATKSLLALYLAKYLTAPMPKDFLGRAIRGVAASGVQIGPDGAPTPFKDAPVAPVPVLYLDRENPRATVGERRGRIGILGRDNFRYWGDWLEENLDSADPQQVFPPEPDDPRLLKWAQETRGFIIFDSLQQWIGDLNENSNTDMPKLMNKFKRLARMCAGVLVLHHNPAPHIVKEGEEPGPKKKYRGATSIAAIPEMSIWLEKNGEGEDTSYTLGDIRFRCCAPWHLTYKLRWGADWGIGVTKDSTPAEEIKERKVQKEAKAADKESAKHAERDKLARLIINSEYNIVLSALVSKANVGSRTKVESLLAGRWTYKKDGNPKWADVGSPAPNVEDRQEN